MADIATCSVFRTRKSFMTAQCILQIDFSINTTSVSQMVQATRSVKQNIAEASMASATSKETKKRLNNVAGASLEELQIDYEDFFKH
jgi:four helix bundle protein